MEIKYIHDICKNYMVIKSDETNIDNFKIKMLGENNIDGLLKVKQKHIDSIEKLYYDISSKQSMEIIYEKSKMKIQDLKQVIYELDYCVEVLKKYLLDFNDIVLNPKMIFIDIKTLKYGFCYYPYYNGDFRKELAEYLNFVITKIDHSDYEALNLAYDLQKITLKENYVIGDLLELFKEPEIIIKEEKPAEAESSYEIPYIKQKIIITEKLIEKLTLVIFVAGILLWVYIYTKTENQILKKVILVIILAIVVYLIYLFIKNNKEKIIKKEKRKIFIDEIKVEEVDNCEEQDEEDSMTVFLGNSDLSSSRFLKSFSDANQDIKIENLPIIIGKMETKSDIIIKDSRVSRMHAKMTFEDQKYFIEDLNSLNGTYLNGERIPPYEKATLYPGDIIKFSEITYKFV